MSAFSFIAQAADDALSRWGLADAVDGQTIANLMAEGASHWEWRMDGPIENVIRICIEVLNQNPTVRIS